MTIIDCCISLKMIKKNLVLLGVVDMRQLLLNSDKICHYLKDLLNHKGDMGDHFDENKNLHQVVPL